MKLCRHPEDTCHFDLLTLCYLKLQILLGVAHVASDSRSTLISFRVGCVNDSGSEQLTTKLLQHQFGCIDCIIIEVDIGCQSLQDCPSKTAKLIASKSNPWQKLLMMVSF